VPGPELVRLTRAPNISRVPADLAVEDESPVTGGRALPPTTKASAYPYGGRVIDRFNSTRACISKVAARVQRTGVVNSHIPRTCSLRAASSAHRPLDGTVQRAHAPWRSPTIWRRRLIHC